MEEGQQTIQAAIADCEFLNTLPTEAVVIDAVVICRLQYLSDGRETFAYAPTKMSGLVFSGMTRGLTAIDDEEWAAWAVQVKNGGGEDS
jgi:hypothetical protein